MGTTLTAGCKINLYLRIVGRRGDGYHELDTVFWPLAEPSDSLRITGGAPGSGLVLRCSDPALDGPGNIVAKAYAAFARASGFAPDWELYLDKGIPMGAGLGGGSADAAVLLRHLNDRAGDKGLGEAELQALAARLGADVPFFLLNQAARATGIGERLTKRPEIAKLLRGLWLVLVCPPVSVSTAKAYGAWDAAQEAGGEIQALTETAQTDIFPISTEAVCLHNCFEPVVYAAHPELRSIKEAFLEMGAAGALLSGSGASLFAVFRSRRAAQEVAGAMGKEATVFVHHL